VAICRALINEPEVLLCDEITGELDTETGEQILRLLKKINQEKGTTILLVTHDEKIAANSDRTVTLSDGRIVSDKTN
jgi:putative ABC transport system ATP-binding protein